MHTPAPYPAARMRRLRRTRALREIGARKRADGGRPDLAGFHSRWRGGIEEPIPSLPGGVNRLSLDRLLPAAERALTPWYSRRFACFPILRKSCAPKIAPKRGTQKNLTNRAIRMLKAELPGPDGHDRYRAGPV